MGGILKGPPSDTPQNPWSQPCAADPPTHQSPNYSDQNALTGAYTQRVGGATQTLSTWNPWVHEYVAA